MSVHSTSIMFLGFMRTRVRVSTRMRSSRFRTTGCRRGNRGGAFEEEDEDIEGDEEGRLLEEIEK